VARTSPGGMFLVPIARDSTQSTSSTTTAASR
jgi:hypothetical protein